VTDDHLLRWLETRFASLKEDIERVMRHLLKVEENHRRCRDHCDETSSVVFQRLVDIEKHNVSCLAGDDIQRKMSQEFREAEDRRIQAQQAFWIKAGAMVAAANIASAIIAVLLSHYWSTPH